MSSVTIYSRADIKGIVKEELNKNINWIYAELKRIRNRITDIEKIIKFYEKEYRFKFPDDYGVAIFRGVDSLCYD